MNCQECQTELLQHATASADALAHLDTCRECQAFAATALLATPATPTHELDAQVQTACHGILAARRLARRRLRLRRLLYAAAACVAILAGVLFHLRRASEASPAGSPQIATAVPLVSKPDALPSAASPTVADVAPRQSLLELYTEALSWDVDVSLSSTELDQMEFDLAMLNAGL